MSQFFPTKILSFLTGPKKHLSQYPPALAACVGSQIPVPSWSCFTLHKKSKHFLDKEGNGKLIREGAVQWRERCVSQTEFTLVLEIPLVHLLNKFRKGRRKTKYSHENKEETKYRAKTDYLL